ncbi:MAG: MBL fold metallo-hydrolase, partial [Deltaproteobacteria bacterium]|nr:MBL fold metallo-hydrolase [Deltaproteobacteria bacterium]
AERAGCGPPCRQWSEHLLAGLEQDLGGRTVDMLWITHQHSDHLGGVPAVLARHAASLYVDNGTRLDTPVVKAARAAAAQRGAPVTVVDPSHPSSPLPSSASVTITAVVPESWPGRCDRHINDCSIGLRIDYCSSSVLFTGDAEADEEAALPIDRPVTLLQVSHHGSETSSSPALLDRVAPRYAVISAADPNEGTNRTYCHPRKSTVERLTEQLGDPTATMRAFAGNRCRGATPADWEDVPASARLYATSRDGDVVLTTTGDGTFTRVAGELAQQ